MRERQFSPTKIRGSWQAFYKRDKTKEAAFAPPLLLSSAPLLAGTAHASGLDQGTGIAHNPAARLVVSAIATPRVICVTCQYRRDGPQTAPRHLNSSLQLKEAALRAASSATY